MSRHVVSASDRDDASQADGSFHSVPAAQVTPSSLSFANTVRRPALTCPVWLSRPLSIPKRAPSWELRT
eukprot:273100-Rhodomonas_salina.1